MTNIKIFAFVFFALADIADFTPATAQNIADTIWFNNNTVNSVVSLSKFNVSQLKNDVPYYILPSQTGNANKVITTNATTTSWASITGSNGITISGLNVAKTKRQETYSGSTDGSGNYTVTFGTSYGAAPNIQPQLISGTNKESMVITVSTTGFTVYVQARTDIAGLLPTYSNVTGRNVKVLITEE